MGLVVVRLRLAINAVASLSSQLRMSLLEGLRQILLGTDSLTSKAENPTNLES